MIAVLFEVTPQPGRQAAYLDTAAALRPLLEQVDGFLSVERFQSLSEPRKLLSLSFWRDEAAVARWRQLEAHRRAQELGRATVFEDYRLRIASVVRDYGMADREQAPGDSREHHETNDARKSGRRA
ncbi:antibiotic biosynthesis monooxygenase [Ramlibacter tataouinensis]|uniref:antibiotic biosynthesis monooxygenase family protein n=1 Tax=Ramlibacter tataouinensis TaxID=94132 RepID=UPI0022F3B49F|nr:antibiotic biosynthesis monooxygenase [Ramlibacter tataouinensis]WBY01395.1 antibiotic biosynthesis monooxygenase [Ramlibacter tataouinensis]